MLPYVLDTSIFITAYRRHYPFDVFQGYWKKLSELAREGKIISIDKVEKEINSNKDKLADWCASNLNKVFFKQSYLPKYDEYLNFIESKSYTEKAKNDFLDSDRADAFIIEYARSKGGVVVTYEVSDPKSKKSIKIPDVCTTFNIECISLIEMFRELKVVI